MQENPIGLRPGSKPSSRAKNFSTTCRPIPQVRPWVLSRAGPLHRFQYVAGEDGGGADAATPGLGQTDPAATKASDKTERTHVISKTLRSD
jgi:hypothetical protein